MNKSKPTGWTPAAVRFRVNWWGGRRKEGRKERQTSKWMWTRSASANVAGKKRRRWLRESREAGWAWLSLVGGRVGWRAPKGKKKKECDTTTRSLIGK